MRKLLAAAVLVCVATQSVAAPPERVTFEGADGKQIAGYVLKPAGDGPFPALVLAHGCGGLFNAKGEIRARDRDWGDRLVAAGFAVVYPDSFNPRGVRSVCTERKPVITPAGRALDVRGAVRWLKTQSFADPDRIAILGWSNGGSTVLRFASRPAATEVKAVVAFYPGCNALFRRGSWTSRVPLRIFIGAADDWTPAEPCRALADKAGDNVRIEVFPDAHHGFDSPGARLRTVKGVAFSANGTGTVHTGTNEPARQAAIAATMKFLAERLARSP